MENCAPMSPCIYVQDGYEENTTTKVEAPETDPIDLVAIQKEMVYINLPNHSPASLNNTNGLPLSHEGRERELIAAENNNFYEDDMECKGSSALLHEQSFPDSVPGPSHTPPTSMCDTSKEKFFCNVCLQKFRSISLLTQHLCATVDLKSFSCVYSDVTVSGTEEALEHAKLHNVAPLFVCTICNVRFDTDETLKCHAKDPCVAEPVSNDHRYASMKVSPDHSYSSKEMKTCCTCKRDFKGAAAYARHLKSRVHRSHALCKSRSSESDHDKTNDNLNANDGEINKKVTDMSPDNSQMVYNTEKPKRVRRTRFSDNSWIVGQHKRKYTSK